MEKKKIHEININGAAYDTYISSFFTKNTNQKYEISAILESHRDLGILNTANVNAVNFLIFSWFKKSIHNTKDIITANCVIKDLIHSNKPWRSVKGYPTHGQRSHGNAKNCKKNKYLLQFRLEQFFQLFGHKKRNIYPTLIVAEYVNKLWFYNWADEWLESFNYAVNMSNEKSQVVPFDPVRLAKNQTNGYTRVGAASKIGKAKKITKVVTIGVPVFFSRFIYYERLPKEFPYRLWISDEDRRKMGKKSKKNLKKSKKLDKKK